MLDQFLEASYGQCKLAEARTTLNARLAQLPQDILYELATGQEKLAYGGGEDTEWLEKFKGTELFDQAYALAREELALTMEENAMRHARRQQEQQLRQHDDWEKRDLQRNDLCVRRKLLELELAALEEGGAPEDEEGEEGGEDDEEPVTVPDPSVAPPPPQQPQAGNKEAEVRARFSAAVKEAQHKEAFTAALAKGLLGAAKTGLQGAGGTLAKGVGRTTAAFQRGGMGAGLQTAGRSALQFAAKHPAVATGAAGLGAGLLAGRATS